MVVPFCHSRRVLPGDPPGVYFCAHPRVHARGSRVDDGVCRACGLWREPAPVAFRTGPAPDPRRATCLHLGSQVGERECESCRGRVRLKVYACGHPDHGEVTLADCATCGDYAPAIALVKDR